MDTTTLPATLQQQYQGQQAEFDALLTELRDAKARNVPLATVYLSPVQHSALMLKHDIGQGLLQRLLKHPDYPGDRLSMLSVSAGASASTYKTTDMHGKEVVLSLTDFPRLRKLTRRIEREARDLGGHLRSDKRLSLHAFLDYYGLPAAEPESSAAIDPLIRELEERSARHSLQLFSGFELDAVRRPATLIDQRILRLLHKRVPTLPMSLDELVSLRTNRKIVDIVRRFLPEQQTSIFTHLIKEAVPDITAEQIRTSPARTLEKLFQSDEAKRLTDVLLKDLNWFGAASEEETSPIVRTKLLGKAIRLWMTKPYSPKDVAGYALRHPSNWGKSYPQIWSEFEQHLLKSRQAASEKEAILLACLLRPEFPLEFQVADIPGELAYRSSVVWVNFVHGVYLANAVDPQLLERLTFQKLLDLPAKQSMKANPEQKNLINATRFRATLDWAITNGFIPDKIEDDFTHKELKTAVRKLDTAINNLKDAASWITIPPPERLNIARLKIEKIFGEKFIAKNIRLTAIGDTTVPQHQFGLYAQRLIPKTHSFVDVYASGKLNENKWFVVDPALHIATATWFQLNEDRTLQSHLGTVAAPSLKTPTLPDIEKNFDTHFKIYLDIIRSAYSKLIAALLASLPLADRRALENGSIAIFSLRRATSGIAAENEQASDTLPLRARNGFIVQATNEDEVVYYEVLPKAGVIRRRQDIEPRHLGGLPKTEKWKVSKGSPVSVAVLRHKTLPFDWDAHVNGTPPIANAQCEAILDAVVNVPASTDSQSSHESIPRTLESQATKNIAYCISWRFLFFDEVLLRKSCYGKTSFEEEQESKDKNLATIKGFVPFWGSMEDLLSGDSTRWIQGTFGMFTDLVSFVLPLGKFAAGTLKIVNTATTVGFNRALPAFAKLTGAFLQSTLNPFDGIASLLRAMGSRGVKLASSGLFKLREAAGRAGRYRIVQGLPQIDDVGRWKPLSRGDQLATVEGIENVPVRNTGSAGSRVLHLVDPLSGKPFGPRLALSQVSVGQASYRRIGLTNNEDLYAIAKTARARQILEVDGRTMVWIDDVAYRVQKNALTRVDRLDASGTLNAAHCRARRVPNGICKTRYVITDTPAERPAVGHFSEENSWAEWFGDSRFTPSPVTSAQPRQLLAFENRIYEVRDNALQLYRGHPSAIGLRRNRPIAKPYIDARLEFQEGIFAGLKVNGSAIQIDDVHEVGAVVAYSLDSQHRYVFARLHTNDYYMTTLAANDSIQKPLRMKKVTEELLQGDTPASELRRIYIGSLNANNLVRIHGWERVHRTLDSLEEFAVAIGAPANPETGLKWVKVTAYPASSLLFDGPTRTTAVTLAEGANVWSRSNLTSAQLQRSVADNFDTLFLRESDPASRGIAIDNAMQDLQSLTPYARSSPRNIAYAEVITARDRKEIYVSVSGAGDNTRHLPIFRSSPDIPVVEKNGMYYFNVDRFRKPAAPEALKLTDDEVLLAIPHPITDPARPDVLERVTSVDSESKLIGYLREEYPNSGDIRSINVVTTLPPCDSCSIIVKGFGQDRHIDDLNVIWGKRPDRQPAP
ncbi:hypothetical protein KVG96_05165 [Pseudomonas sp. COR58]|uniref:The BURPS668_1122 family of deaminases n=1 Tax=Pseudomonas ekonensis TaxID=2842353 RepID=A0ABS6PA32_9PSED|nr:hypothetical protein [Pseudomonas ekonensis]MBV4457335.1 hypothetical protein [Pseudomonas ekonensis]